MSKSTFAKTKAQIKSYQYYIFWGACTFAVMAGQIFVGAGYQSMSQSVRDLTEIIEIKIELEELRKSRGFVYWYHILILILILPFLFQLQ